MPTTPADKPIINSIIDPIIEPITEPIIEPIIEYSHRAKIALNRTRRRRHWIIHTVYKALLVIHHTRVRGIVGSGYQLQKVENNNKMANGLLEVWWETIGDESYTAYHTTTNFRS